VSQNFYKSKVR